MLIRWFALTAQETFIDLGLHGDIEEADRHTPGNTVWLLDEYDAVKWINQIQDIVGNPATSVRSWLCICQFGNIEYIGEFDTIQGADDSLKYGCIWLLSYHTALSWARQLSNMLEKNRSPIRDIASTRRTEFSENMLAK